MKLTSDIALELIENFRNKSFSYSQLYKELELINNRVSVTEEKVEQTVKFLSSLKDDTSQNRDARIQNHKSI